MNGLGLESGRVRVVPYNAGWPGLYAAEVERFQPFLERAGIRLAVEHSGSTSVPGLAAKPIIDILAGLGREDERSQVIAALQEAGYVYRGEQGIPGRDFFRRGTPRQYHVHLTSIGSVFWHEHLDFRNWLRAHQDVADAYMTLKRGLADRYPADREAYTNGKTGFILEVLQAARSP